MKHTPTPKHPKQDPTLFSGTIRSNLDPFGAHDDAALWEALRKASLDASVRAHPLGLDQVGDGLVGCWWVVWEGWGMGRRSVLSLSISLAPPTTTTPTKVKKKLDRIFLTHPNTITAT